MNPPKYLESKLRVTKWLIGKAVQNGSPKLEMSIWNDKAVLNFVRQSPLIYRLYEEDHAFLLAKINPAAVHDNLSQRLAQNGGDDEDQGRRDLHYSHSSGHNFGHSYQMPADDDSWEPL
jgi:hypothetical protein